jgi:hypothetical protein
MTRASVRNLPLAFALTLVGALSWASSSSALIRPAQVLDGPSSLIIDVDGAALAPDGTGGIVYRRFVDGLPHLFAVRFYKGTWSAPIRVDSAGRFAASTPTIAAGNGGRLLVVWATPWAVRHDGRTHYQLMSSVLDPGARGFGPAMEIDPDDVGDGTAAYPSVAMAPGGAAYVAYRVVTDPLDFTSATGIQPMRPGDELMDVRVARFNGMTWSALGAVNRLEGQVTMRPPTAENAPVIRTDLAGTSAVVLWQEPGIDGVARIWARRISGTTEGYVLPVSPSTLDGKPVTVDADMPALAVSTLAEAKAVFRLQGGAGSPTGHEQILLNSLPPSTSDDAQEFTGVDPLDAGDDIGPASVSLDPDSGFRLGYVDDGVRKIVSGTIDGRGQPVSIAPSGSDDRLLVTHDEEGGGVAAWTASDDGGRPVVAVRQDFPGGDWQSASLTAPVSGRVDGLALGESDRGDALVAFRQGSDEQSAVLGSISSSTPAAFTATAPRQWLVPRNARVSWSPARSIVGRVSYEVLVDGQKRATGLTGRFTRINPSGLGDGRHAVDVIAVDHDGQERLGAAATLRIDGNPPRVSVRKHGRRGIVVLVQDSASGLRKPATRISFGDRSRVVRGKARATHRYRRSGRYTVVVRSLDRVGHHGVWRQRVQVR